MRKAIYDAEESLSLCRCVNTAGKHVAKHQHSKQAMHLFAAPPVQARGNADMSRRSDPHHEFSGLNCLIEVQTVEQTAAATGEWCERFDVLPASNSHCAAS